MLAAETMRGSSRTLESSGGAAMQGGREGGRRGGQREQLGGAPYAQHQLEGAGEMGM